MSDPNISNVHRTFESVINNSSLWVLFALVAGGGASVMALGLLLRGNEAITSRAVVGTVLHSIAWGSAVFLLLVDQYGLSLPFILGVSTLSGLGAASFIDLVLLLVKRNLGFSVVIQKKSDSRNGELQ